MSTAVETDKMAALATAANEARGLAMDSIAAAHSGHMGLPLGAAEIGASLYGSQVSFFFRTSFQDAIASFVSHFALLSLRYVTFPYSYID
jgi:transketolase N-terminal domain/subunit